MIKTTPQYSKEKLNIMKGIGGLGSLIATIAQIYIIYNNASDMNILIPMLLIIVAETYIYITRREIINYILNNQK